MTNGPSGPGIDVSPFFKWFLIAVAGLTLFSGFASLYLAGKPNPSPEAKNLIPIFTATWNSGFGAFLGLLGGKAL